MKFIELTGRQLIQVVKGDELQPADLERAGVHNESIVRINPQGDIELRLRDRWEIIGGLIGDYEHRIERQTGMRWA